MPDLADGQLQRNINPKGNNSTWAMPFRTPLNADGSIITHGHEGNLLLEAGQLREEEPISSVWCLCQHTVRQHEETQANSEKISLKNSFFHSTAVMKPKPAQCSQASLHLLAQFTCLIYLFITRKMPQEESQHWPRGVRWHQLSLT